MGQLINNFKTNFIGINKSFTNYDTYTFSQNELLTNEPVHLGYVVKELSELLMYKTY